MTEDEIKEMREIFSEYLEKTRGYEARIRETYAHVALWVKDPDMQVTNLNIAAHSLANSQYYACKAAELVRALSERIRARRKGLRNVA